MSKRFTIKNQDDYFGITDNNSADKVNIINGIHTEIEVEWLCNFLNEQEDKISDNIKFKNKVYVAIDKRIMTLHANSKQCHMGGSHDKGIEFTLQAEMLERLKEELFL